MKKTILALSLLSGLCAASLTSCEKVKDSLFPAFDVEMNDVSVTIPITVEGVERSTSSTVAFNLDSAIKAYTSNAFSISNLSSVKVKDVGVVLTNTDALNDLSNFETVSVKLSSNTVSTPAIIASAAVPDAPGTSLNIPITNPPELKEYLKGNQLTYTITGTARQTTTKPLNATVSVTLAIK
jgi:hypothetical protein